MDRPTPLSDLPPDVEAQFEVFEADPEAAETSGLWTVDSLDRANWAIARIGQHRARLAEVKRFAAAEQQRLAEQSERIAAWLADETEQVAQSCGFLEAELARYHQAKLDEDPKRKTIKLPAGELHARKAQDRWDIDPAAVIAWAEANDREDLIRRKDPEVDRAAVKKLFTHANGPAGTVSPGFDPLSGDIVDGVNVTVGEVEFTVVTPEVDR